MFFDWTYVIIVMPMLIISMIAQVKVKSTYSKYSRVFSRRGYTAEQAARLILDRNGLQNVESVGFPASLPIIMIRMKQYDIFVSECLRQQLGGGDRGRCT